MSSKKLIIDEINRIKADDTKLYSFLYDLVYNGYENDIIFLENLYMSFLDDERIEIRQVSIYALLFGLKLQNEKYKK